MNVNAVKEAIERIDLAKGRPSRELDFWIADAFGNMRVVTVLNPTGRGSRTRWFPPGISQENGRGLCLPKITAELRSARSFIRKSTGKEPEGTEPMIMLRACLCDLLGDA